MEWITEWPGTLIPVFISIVSMMVAVIAVCLSFRRR